MARDRSDEGSLRGPYMESGRSRGVLQRERGVGRRCATSVTIHRDCVKAFPTSVFHFSIFPFSVEMYRTAARRYRPSEGDLASPRTQFRFIRERLEMEGLLKFIAIVRMSENPRY